MRRKSICLILLLIISAIFLVSAEEHGFGDGSFKIPNEATAKTLDGETVSLTDFKGKLIFLNIWKTDCVPCLIEIPLLNRLQKEYSSETFTVIGLSMDRGKDKFVAQLVDMVNVAYPVWLGYGQPIAKYVGPPYVPPFTPTLVAIGPDGEVIGYVAGAFPTYKDAVNTMNRARKLVGGNKTEE